MAFDFYGTLRLDTGFFVVSLCPSVCLSGLIRSRSDSPQNS